MGFTCRGRFPVWLLVEGQPRRMETVVYEYALVAR